MGGFFRLVVNVNHYGGLWQRKEKKCHIALKIFLVLCASVFGPKVGSSQGCYHNFRQLPWNKFLTWCFWQDVALFEMNQSDSKEEDGSEESSQDSSEDSSDSEEDDTASSEVTTDNFKLPHSEDGKGKIEVLDSPASKKRKE